MASPPTPRPGLRQVRAAQLRARARKRAIAQVLFGSVFLIGALAYARAPDRHERSSITWMTLLVLFSTVDVAVGLRVLARLARRGPALWVLGSAAWGALSVALLGFLLRT